MKLVENGYQTQGLDDTLIKYANVHLENINIDLLEYVKPKSEKLLIPTNKLVHAYVFRSGRY